MAPSEPGSLKRRAFPALDTEPAPPSLRRRLIVPAALIVLAGVIVAAVILVPRLLPKRAPASAASARAKAELASADGQIMSLTSAQNLVLSRPAGTNVIKLPALQSVGQQVAPALDNRYLALGDGQVIAAGPGKRPAYAQTGIYPFINGMQTVFTDPFADHDAELLAMEDPNGGPPFLNDVSAFSLATGRQVSLGVADAMAGDPQAAGAFEAIPVNREATSNADAVSPDSKIVLRDAGRHPVVLATAAALNSDVGLGTSLPVTLTPYPSPAGDQVAIGVSTVSGNSPGQEGIVVLNRLGELLGMIPAAQGPRGVNGLAWSPSGTKLAYPVTGHKGQELAIWTIGVEVTTQGFPSGGRSVYDGCLWSPDSKSILCIDVEPSDTNGSKWVFANAAGGPMVPVTGPGSAVAWLP